MAGIESLTSCRLLSFLFPSIYENKFSTFLEIKKPKLSFRLSFCGEREDRVIHKTAGGSFKRGASRRWGIKLLEIQDYSPLIRLMIPNGYPWFYLIDNQYIKIELLPYSPNSSLLIWFHLFSFVNRLQKFFHKVIMHW